MTPEWKICATKGCNDDKPQPLENFDKSRSWRDNHHAKCKKCRREERRLKDAAQKEEREKYGFNF